MEAPHFTIREARPEDADAVLAYMHQIISDHRSGVLFTVREFTRTVEEQRQLIHEYHDFQNSAMFIAETEDGVIAVSGWRGGNRDVNRHVVNMGITVSADWRNRGVGSAVMQHGIAWAKHNPTVRRLELEVFGNNLHAIYIYEKFGFEVEGRRRMAYFKDGQFRDVLIMSIIFE